MPLLIYKDNQELGPFDEADIADRLRRGELSPNDLGRYSQSSQWMPLSTFFPPDPMAQPGSSGWSEAATQQIPYPSSSPYSTNPTGSSPYMPPPAPNLVYPSGPMPVGSTGNPTRLPQIGMVLGIMTASLMVVGLVPCLGWVNWLTLLVGLISLVICLIPLATEKDPQARNKAMIGILLTGGALVLGMIRLFFGGGCF